MRCAHRLRVGSLVLAAACAVVGVFGAMPAASSAQRPAPALKRGLLEKPTTANSDADLMSVAPTLALAASSAEVSFGANLFGELGDGAEGGFSDVPVEVKGLSGLAGIAAGYFDGLAVLGDGHVMDWGENHYGQLGNGTTTGSDLPVEVKGVSEAAGVAGGTDFMLALLKSGKIMAWGVNEYGELGDGTTTNRTEPVEVKKITEAVGASAGFSHGLAVLKNGKVMAWGENHYGELGDGTTTERKEPVETKKIGEAVAVAAGYVHSLALLKNGKVMAWGENHYGQLGNGSTKESTEPVEVKGLSNVTSIAAGAYHSLAVLANGKVMAWGDNHYGELGNGGTRQSTEPVEVKKISEAVAVSGGLNHSLAVLKNGKAMAWGYNHYGQLGDGTTTERTEPVEVKGISEAVGVAAGAEFSFVRNAERPPMNVKPPTVSGVPAVGQTLTATIGSWEGSQPISYAFQWQSCNASGGECEDIEGATGQSYTIGTSDEQRTLRVTVTASNSAGHTQANSAVTAEVKASPPSELEAPSTYGIPNVGEFLHADAGVWDGDAVELAYQWQLCNGEGRECQDIPGASEQELTLTEADLDKSLRVRVGASDSLGAVSAVSPATEPVGAQSLLADTLAPSISGTPLNGQTLSANTGSWLASATITYAYQWERCNPDGSGCASITGASGSTYALGASDVGKSVRVSVRASESEGASQARSDVSLLSQTIAATGAPVVQAAPQITGSPMEGQTLSTSDGAFSGEGPITYALQWERCNEYGQSCTAIAGATAGSYALSSADVGSTLRVVVSATGSGGTTSALSGPSAVIAPQTLAGLSAPSISGEDHEGQTLSATPGIWTGQGTISFAYEWQRCNESGGECATIEGQTEQTYATGSADVGKTLKVVVEAKLGSESAKATSSATAKIGGEPTAPVELSDPTLEGGATAGQTLSVNVGGWTGTQPISYAYQWQKCNSEGGECANVEGATGQSYTLPEGDVGASVKALLTASNTAGTTQASTEASEAIDTPGPPENTGKPAINGTAQEGQRLTASVGTWLGTRPLRYAFQWLRCEANGEGCGAIEGATSVAYTPASADAGHALRVKLSATNSAGSVGAESAQTQPVAAAAQANNTEATETVQASTPSLIATSTEATLEGDAVKPQAVDSGEELTSASTLTSSSISKETPGELAVNSADGQLALEPQGTSLTAASMPSIVNGSAAMFAGAYPHTDMVVRPEALGASTLLYLQSKEAPTTFSWNVRLGLDQELVQLEDGAVAIVETSPESFTEPAPGEETPESAEGAPKASSTSEEGISAQEAEEKAAEEKPGSFEALTKAPTQNTLAVQPKEGELQPQQTKSVYEAATSAISYAESKTGGHTLLVIEPPQARDVSGNTVATSLSVNGNTVTLTVADPPEYPVSAETAVAGHTDNHIAGLKHGYTYGLSDQSATPFEKYDPKLTSGKGALPKQGITVARDVIPYNIINGQRPREENAIGKLITWLQEVKVDHLTPYLTLATLGSLSKHQFCDENGVHETSKECFKRAPTTHEYEKDLEKLLLELHSKRSEEAKNGQTTIPLVALWGSWNEPDIGVEGHSIRNPLFEHPEVAARFWAIEHHVLLEWAPAHLEEYKNCKHCRIVAGEFSSDAGSEHKRYIEKYIATILEHNRRHEWPKPAVWGLHDYGDLVSYWHDHENAGLRAMVDILQSHRLGHPHIWLSEQGVLLRSGSPTSLDGHLQRQREAANDFSHLAEDAKRYVEVVDYYEYRGPSQQAIENAAKEHKPYPFDSGLRWGEGVPGHSTPPYDERPAYCVLVLGIKNSSCPPRAKTASAVNGTVKAHSSSVLLSVDPNGASSNYWVEYGTNTQYGHNTTVTPVANPEGEQSEAVALSGLEPCTTYHYQAEAENEASEGTPSLGGDETFSTKCPATAVAGGWSHVCALLETGGVDCWGGNSLGQLGDGTTTASNTPVPVSGITKATAIAAGPTGSCAVISGGTVECWGQNGDPPASPQLSSPLGGSEAVEASPRASGGGTTGAPSLSASVEPSLATDSLTPVPVSGIANATALTVGIQFECALLSTGHIDCWGDGAQGQLGDGTTESSSTPVAVSGISTAVAITAGREYACALLSGGSVECWGYPPNSTTIETTPHPVSGISSGTAIADAGYAHICAVVSSGEDYCWGYNENGQLGNGKYEYSYTPVKVQGLSGAATQPGGSVVSSCALLSSGAVECWGANEDGELGDGTTNASLTPVPVSGISSATATTGGEYTGCALLSSGAIECWGAGGSGQLGDGGTANSLVPVPVSGIG